MVDPNGQVSVSYIDAHGRTIATALAGESPANLDQLGHFETASTIPFDLINNVRNDLELTSSASLLVTSTGNFTFTYTLSDPDGYRDFQPDCVMPADLCYDCLYDLEIRLSDNCGNLFNGGTPLVIDATQVSANEIFNIDCPGEPSSLDQAFVENLPIGEYQITKTLRLSQSALQFYVDHYLKQVTCLPSLEDLKQVFIDSLDFSGCDTLIIDENIGECESLLSVLKADVTPGGQYASFTISNDVLSPGDTASIFSNQSARYYPTFTYLDDNNQPITVNVNGQNKTPGQLSPEEFYQFFQPAWANTLVTAHPEYCFYEWCTQNQTSADFNDQLRAVETLQAAIDSGLVTAQGDILSSDPFFMPGATGFSLLSDMQFLLAHMNPFTVTNESALKFVATQSYYNCGTAACFGTGTDAENDYAWQMLRGLYLSFKHQQESKKRLEFCDPEITCNNPFAALQSPEPRIELRSSAAAAEILCLKRRVTNTVLTSDDFDLATVDSIRIAQDSLIALECEQNCQAQVDIWLEQLKGCNIPDTDPVWIEVEQRLVAVCQASCDSIPNYLYGASTVPLDEMGNPIPAGTFQDTSFIEAIFEAIDTLSACNIDCDPYSLLFPPKYELPNYNGSRPSISPDDAPCACDQLADLESCYNTDPQGYATFPDFLASLSDVDFTQTDVDTLTRYCTQITSRYWPYEVNLPPYLECNVCKDCSEIQAIIDDFNLICMPSNPDYEALRTNYLNYQTGFNLNAFEYEAFLAKCGGATCIDALILCPSNTFKKVTYVNDCRASLIETAEAQAEEAYQSLLDSLRNEFIFNYTETCLPDNVDSLYATGTFQEYHYTLYYYDQAGNLVKTIPPNGVNPLSSSFWDAVANHRADNNLPFIRPNHTYETRYVYNTLNQVTREISPDTDEKLFWYDRVGRLVVSQDGRQRELGDTYSYTVYDRLGRIVEVGEKKNTTTAMSNTIARDPVALQNWIDEGAANTKTFVTKTFYDFTQLSVPSFGAEGQGKLRTRIAHATYEKVNDDNKNTYDNATHYAYDVSGNVRTLVQEIGALRPYGQSFKRIDYDYDYISGNVNAVYYQRDSADQFTYRYLYDADNRISEVYTSFINTDEPLESPFWEKDAAYEYYDHGPLARMTLGENNVQGMDYAYTLQGWIKGMNSSVLRPDKDMGKDGFGGSDNEFFGRDAFSYTLGYYDGDYSPIGGMNADFEVDYAGSNFNANSSNLFNGNIRNIVSQNKAFPDIFGYQYQYDQLNRIKSMNLSQLTDPNTFAWINNETSTNKYATTYDYDPNGNILGLTRQGDNGLMDGFTYNYLGLNNRLGHVDDAVNAGIYPNDLDDQAAGNYSYDGSGNMTQDMQKGMTLNWTGFGKVNQVTLPGSSILFDYDANQNRIQKDSTIYVRDAQGSIMAIYETSVNDSLRWKEQHLYGSARLGILQPGLQWRNTEIPDSPAFLTSTSLIEGQKAYELSNHLGNVFTTISDRKSGRDINSNNEADYFESVVLSGTDYFPFGLEMPGREVNLAQQRFQFNNQEYDPEWENIHFTFREYDKHTVRMRSVDPLYGEYPYYSPYQIAGNTPIWAKELEGLEPWTTNSGSTVYGPYSHEYADATGLTPGGSTPNPSGLIDFENSRVVDPTGRDVISRPGRTTGVLKGQVVTVEAEGIVWDDREEVLVIQKD